MLLPRCLDYNVVAEIYHQDGGCQRHHEPDDAQDSKEYATGTIPLRVLDYMLFEESPEEKVWSEMTSSIRMSMYFTQKLTSPRGRVVGKTCMSVLEMWDANG